MDRIESTVDIIRNLNLYRDGELAEDLFISKVCSYFDNTRKFELSSADKNLLLYICNVIGIPHYYDMLFDPSETVEPPLQIGLSGFSSFVYESSLTINDKSKIHKFQKEVYDLFRDDMRNRFFLSASTSFGKTFLVYEVIKKMRYENILLVFPTIALLAENLERLKEDDNYHFFREEYTIHTLSDEREEFESNNIFLFTPERYLSFIDKNEGRIEFDFCFVDEIYKIDNDYIIDEEARENDRDVAYRLAIHEIFSKNIDADSLLVGPYINLPERGENIPSFHKFLDRFSISPIDKNNIEIVNKDRISIPRTNQTINFDKLTFDFSNNRQKAKQLSVILNEIRSNDENAIIYCYSKTSVESYARKFMSFEDREHDFSEYENFITHIESKFDADWIVPRALKKGIGIHHGVVPKYIQKEIINQFNEGNLRILFSTTTITEGVNTTAKNIVIMHHKKGTKVLKQFDAKNIEGRAGRFLAHYQGRVIILDPQFERIIQQEPEEIKHKNFDVEAPKDDVDLDITDQQYLSAENIARKEYLINLQQEKGIPDSVLGQFKSISKADKMHVFDKIASFSRSDHESITELIRKVNYSKPTIDYEGFQIVLSTFEEIVKDKNLIWLLGKSEFNREEPDEFSRVTHKLYYYLRDGFMGAVEFQQNTMGDDIDKAIRKASEFVYNTLKYQLVKYLGVFNSMYKYERSLQLGDSVEEVKGIDRLLTKLEYNAYNYSARIASDYGAPYNVIRYFDTEQESRNRFQLDSFEAKIKDKISNLLLNR